MQQLKFVGLAGFATVGKDLFYSILNDVYPSIRFSLGDVLKREMRESLLEETSIDILNCSKEDKEKIRPMLVEYGRKKRQETGGRYFIDRLTQQMSHCFTLSKIPVITDIRYAQYENDEISWLKKDLGGVLVYIKKYKNINGKKEYVEAPNEDEAKNDPLLRKHADYVVDWEVVEGGVYERQRLLTPHAEKFIDWYDKIL